MKKGVGVIVFLILTLFLMTNIVRAAADVSVEVSAVLTAPPVLELLKPENKTYLINESFLLEYFVDVADRVWYNIDNLGDISVSSPLTYFNISQGSHILYLYAENVKGNSSVNVSFTIDSTRFIILYEEYKGNTKGSSTDLIRYAYEDLGSLDDVVLENSEYGKIKFNEVIDLMSDANPGDDMIDLDLYTDISQRRIEIDAMNLPNFNKSATLWFYDVGFNNPRILRDGSVCASSVCSGINYAGGILSFNVTGFGVYSVEETPVLVSATPSRGGGGVSRGFSVDKERINISLKQEETKGDLIVIKNIGFEKLNISLENLGLADFIKISETEFSLDAGESKVIILDFLARYDAVPDLYIGEIIVRAGKIEKRILTSIEVETKSALFDVEVELAKKPYVVPGEELSANIKIYNLGKVGKIDTLVDYSIMDEKGNEIIYERETITVETFMSFIKDFKISKEIEYGRYVLYVKVSYDGQVGSASVWFNVDKEGFFRKNLLIIIGAVLGILIVLVIFYLPNKERIKEILVHKRGMVRLKMF